MLFVVTSLAPCPVIFLQVDDGLKLTDDSRQLSAMLLHSVPKDTNGLEGRSLLDFFAEEDRARISQQFQSSISSESTLVMALNADMFDSDQNRVKVELFHAQFQNLAHQRCFLVGVREVQVEDATGAFIPASNVANTAAGESSGELWVFFDLPSFEILVLSVDLEQLCQRHLSQTPENILDMSCPSSRAAFCHTLQVLTKNSLQGHTTEQRKKETFQFNLLGAGDVTATFFAERDELLDTAVGHLKVLTSLRPRDGFGLSSSLQASSQARFGSVTSCVWWGKIGP